MSVISTFLCLIHIFKIDIQAQYGIKPQNTTKHPKNGFIILIQQLRGNLRTV